MGRLTTSKFRFSLRKAAALILLAATMLLLFSPSLHASVKTDEGTKSFSSILKDYKEGSLKNEIYDYVYDYVSEDLWDLYFESSNYVRNELGKVLSPVINPIIDAIDDILINAKYNNGELSPLGAARAASDFHALCKQIIDSFEVTSEGNEDVMHAKQAAFISACFLWGSLAMFCLSAIFCAKRILFDNKNTAVSLSIFIAVYIAALIAVTVLNANNDVILSGKTALLRLLTQKYGTEDELLYEVIDALKQLFAADYTRLKLSITAFPFLSFACSIAVGIVPDLIPENIDVKAPTIPNLSGLAELSGISLDTGWICECGKKNKASATFCAECGKKRVDYSRCENCGAVLARGSAFCSKCGTPVNRKVFEPVCPSCGKSLKSGTKFCIYCGTPINSDAEAVPADEPRTRAADEYTSAPEMRPESRAPEMRPEKRTDSGYTPSPAKSPAAEEQQSSGRLKIKRGGDVEYK